MSSKDIVTPNLKLVIESLEGTHARINAMPDADKSELSPAWLALLDSAKEEDPWILGFNMVLRDENVIVGQCGFKGPPTPAGMVEIAYGVEPTKQGNGYAGIALFGDLEGTMNFTHVETEVINNYLVKSRYMRKLKES